MKSISLSNLIGFVTLVLVPTIFWFAVAELVAVLRPRAAQGAPLRLHVLHADRAPRSARGRRHDLADLRDLARPARRLQLGQLLGHQAEYLVLALPRRGLDGPVRDAPADELTSTG